MKREQLEKWCEDFYVKNCFSFLNLMQLTVRVIRKLAKKLNNCYKQNINIFYSIKLYTLFRSFLIKLEIGRN